MSNSKHDNNEFQYLEARLRQTKPPTDPMSPALKRRLLADLTETNSMKTTFWPLQSLGNALVALFLLIGLPLLFWGVLVSLNTQATTGPGDAAPTPQSEDALDELATPTAIPGAADLQPETPSAYYLDVTATPIPTQTPAVFNPQYPMINSPDARVVARITEIGEPVLSEEHAIGDSTPYVLPITVETTLVGYEEATLIVGMTTVTRAEPAADAEANSDPGTLTMAGESQSQIVEGTGTQVVTFLLSETQLTEDLALSPDISFHLKVLYENENTGQLMTVDAAGVRPSAETQAVLPAPEWAEQSHFQVISVSDEGAPDFRTVNLTVVHAPAEEQGELDIRVATLDGNILAEETHPISAESARTSLHIQLPAEDLDEVNQLAFDATVRVNGSEQSLSQIVPAYATEGVAADQIELEAIQVDPIGDALRFTLLLRYHLTNAHESGFISHSSRFESSSGGGGGGGGGGSRIEVPAGQGLAVVSFNLSGPGLTADNWHDLVTIELDLLAEDGSETHSLHTLQPDIAPTPTPLP